MNLALFDFDGTLTTKDSFTPFLFFATPKARLALGRLMLMPVVAAYKLGIIPAKIMRPFSAYYCFRNLSSASLDKLGKKYAKKHIPKLIRPEALEQMRWHQSRGDHVVIVSASLDTYLRPWCERNQIDLICSTLEKKEGQYSGRYVHGDCSYEQKAKRLKSELNLTDYHQIYAYGDTPEDKHLLELATVPVYQWEFFPRG